MSKKWNIQISEPKVIFQEKEGIQGWGRHQFPSLMVTKSGKIRLHWSDGQDYVGAPPRVHYNRMTADGGETWYEGYEDSRPTVKMPNGKYYAGVRCGGRSTVPAADLNLEGLTPVTTWMDGRYRMYHMEDLRGDPAAEAMGLFDMTLMEYDAETDTTTEVPCTIHWPNAPLCVYHTGHVYKIGGMFSLSGHCVFTHGDTVYFVLYGMGMDSAADREHAVSPEFQGDRSIYIFSSPDSGRTWNYLSQISPDDKVREDSVDYLDYKSEYEGFSEPWTIVLPNGDFFMLIRSGMTRTLFFSRSSDKGKTWTHPEKFDDFGVLPKVVQLPCGVTLAVYGRPCLRFRYTTDPEGKVWEDPIELPVSPDEPNYRNRSCFYTGFLPVDDHTVMLAHMDFLYPNERGVGVRTVLVRKITVSEA